MADSAATLVAMPPNPVLTGMVANKRYALDVVVDGAGEYALELVEVVPNTFISFGASGIPTIKPVADVATAAQLAALVSETMVVAATDVTNSTTSWANVTGLTFEAVAGETYVFRAHLAMTSASTGTGLKAGINGPAATFVVGSTQSANTTATTRIDNWNAYDSGGPSLGTPSGTFYVGVDGVLCASASGTVTLRFASEVAASAVVVKAGSALFWRRTL